MGAGTADHGRHLLNPIEWNLLRAIDTLYHRLPASQLHHPRILYSDLELLGTDRVVADPARHGPGRVTRGSLCFFNENDPTIGSKRQQISRASPSDVSRRNGVCLLFCVAHPVLSFFLALPSAFGCGVARWRLFQEESRRMM